MIKSKIKTVLLLVILFVFAPIPVIADHCDTLGDPDSVAVKNCELNYEDFHPQESANFSPQGGDLEQDTGEPITANPIYVRLNEIINVLSIGVGIVVTASVVFAGIQYITSRGDPNKTQAAVKRITQAGIALALYVFGWTILNWLIPGGALG